MNSTDAFQAFFERVAQRLLAETVEHELNDLRCRDLEQWMGLHEQLRGLLPVVGTVGQQALIFQRLLDALAATSNVTVELMIQRTLIAADLHYRNNREELQQALKEYTISFGSPSEIADDLLEQSRPPTDPPTTST